MLIWVCAAALVLAAILSARWGGNRVDSLGRPRGFPTISVGLCLAVAVGGAVPVGLHARTERRLSAVASKVAGLSLTVHCQTVGEASLDVGQELGYVAFDESGVPERRTVIKRGPCAELSKGLGADPAGVSRDMLIAVHVLTHETMHMAGTTDEAITECQAMQRDAVTARLLGADADAARALAVRYHREIYPSMPSTYRTDNCVPGGSLDERLPDAPWS